MRNRIDLIPHRFKTTKTSGSNTFVSKFAFGAKPKGVVVERGKTDSWLNYKRAIQFAVLVGLMTYLLLEVLM